MRYTAFLSALRLRRPVGLQDVLVPIFFISLIVVQAITFAADPGLGWHLKTGDLILSQGSIPRVDPFLAPARPWIAEQWLSAVILAWLYRHGSWALLYAAMSIMYLATFALLLYGPVAALLTRSGRREGETPRTAFMLTACCLALAFKLGQSHFVLRPVLFSFPLFAVVYVLIYRLYRVSQGQALLGSSYRRALWALPLVFLLWANLHPSFLIGLVVVGALPVSLALDRFGLGRAPCRALSIPKLALLVAAAAGATLINPFGYHLHGTVLALLRSDFAVRYYEEWHSPDFREYSGLLFELFLGLIGAALLFGRGRGLRWGFFEVGLLLGFSHLALQSARMLPYFAIAACVPLGEALLSLSAWAADGPLRVLLQPLRNLERREARSWRGRLSFGVCAAGLLAYAAATGSLPLYRGALGPSETEFPYAALAALKEAATPNSPAVVANAMDWGGFVTYAAWPDVKAIIDDRTVLLGDAFYRRYFAELTPRGDWRGYLKQAGATHLLLPANTALAQMILAQNALPVLYRDEQAIVFVVRDGGVTRVGRAEFSSFHPDTPNPSSVLNSAHP